MFRPLELRRIREDARFFLSDSRPIRLGLCAIAAVGVAIGLGGFDVLPGPSSAEVGQSKPTLELKDKVGVAGSCEDQTWPYLEGRCLQGTNSRPVRVISMAERQQPASKPQTVGLAAPLAGQTREAPKKPRKAAPVRLQAPNSAADARAAYAAPWAYREEGKRAEQASPFRQPPLRRTVD